MREFRLSFPACVIAGKTRLDLHDVILLKTYSLPSGVCDNRDAMTLMVLNACCPEKCPEWQTYFVETMASYIVTTLEPKNALNQNKLQWITEMFTTNGLANSPIESDLLQHIMDLLARPCRNKRAEVAKATKRGATSVASSSITNFTEQLSLKRAKLGALERQHNSGPCKQAFIR